MAPSRRMGVRGGSLGKSFGSFLFMEKRTPFPVFQKEKSLFFFFAERKRTKKKPQAHRLTACAKKSRGECGSRTFSCPVDKKYGGARRSEKSVRQGTLSRAGQIAEKPSRARRRGSSQSQTAPARRLTANAQNA